MAISLSLINDIIRQYTIGKYRPLEIHLRVLDWMNLRYLLYCEKRTVYVDFKTCDKKIANFLFIGVILIPYISREENWSPDFKVWISMINQRYRLLSKYPITFGNVRYQLGNIPEDHVILKYGNGKEVVVNMRNQQV